jgi:hypothetical protein
MLHSGLPRGHNKNDKIQKKSYFHQIQSILTLWQTRPAWAGFKTAEEGRTKIM